MCVARVRHARVCSLVDYKNMGFQLGLTMEKSVIQTLIIYYFCVFPIQHPALARQLTTSVFSQCQDSFKLQKHSH